MNRAIASIKPALATNPDTQEMPSWMTMLFSIASGLLAANVYYSQPIAELIATSLGFSSSATGLIVACGVLRLGRKHVWLDARVGLGTAEAGANRDDLVSRAPEVNEPLGAHNTRPSAAGTLPGLSVRGV